MNNLPNLARNQNKPDKKSRRLLENGKLIPLTDTVKKATEKLKYHMRAKNAGIGLL